MPRLLIRRPATRTSSALEHVEAVLDLLRVVGDVVLRDVEGVVALVLQRLELLAAHLQQI